MSSYDFNAILKTSNDFFGPTQDVIHKNNTDTVIDNRIKNLLFVFIVVFISYLSLSIITI